MMYDFLIVGGGVFGVTSAIALAQRKYNVGLINPDTIPHHLAASTDITKAVRMEYGSDIEYFKMAETCIERWKDWNDLLNVKLYHEVGFLMLSRAGLNSPGSTYERHSYDRLIEGGYHPERLDPSALHDRFPAVGEGAYLEGIFNPHGGYVTSGQAIHHLASYARSLGVTIHKGQTAQELVISEGRLQEVKTREGMSIGCGHAIIAAGAHTPLLLPGLRPYIRTTGHPVFWLRPNHPINFTADRLPVFMADIANTGWYGFPYFQKHGIVKIAKHTAGLSLHPDRDDRVVTDADIIDMRQFVAESFPALATAPLVYTRRCLYTDTLDGHFWIDRHPEIEGLSVSSGGSGHGMKMGPVLGEMTADVAEGKDHGYSQRYNWRVLSTDTIQTEEARYIVDRKI